MGDWLINAGSSPWVFPPLGIVLNICILPYVLRHANPLTAEAVLSISLVVTSFFCNLLFISISGISRLLGKMIHQDGKRDETLSGIIEVQGLLIERVKQSDKRPKIKKLPKN